MIVQIIRNVQISEGQIIRAILLSKLKKSVLGTCGAMEIRTHDFGKKTFTLHNMLTNANFRLKFCLQLF